jgi:1-acyl-sn-glycerol-3-phosphate acyltransferase
MQIIRSFLFNIYVYVVTLGMGILWLPTLLAPTHRPTLYGIKIWGRSLKWGLRVLCGIDHKVLGQEHLEDGPQIIAAKHQSVWETAMLFTLIENPAFVLKRELLWIPFIGWYCAKCRMIAVDRNAGSKALKSMVAQAKERLQEGRTIVIFPEGTRRGPADPPDYKPGIAALYTQLGVPCSPAATNSGLFWPRRTIIKNPGTISLEFLPQIPPGLKRREFSARLEQDIEQATQNLISS